MSAKEQDSSRPTDADEQALLPSAEKRIIVGRASKGGTGIDKYFPSRDRRLSFRGMEVKSQKVAVGAMTSGLTNGILLKQKPTLYNYIQNPYIDSDLGDFEAQARSNHAIKSAIGVREFFVFGKGSELVAEFPEEEAEQMTKEAVKQKLDANPKWKEAIKNIAKIDEKVGLKHAERTFYWQMLVFGRALILKLFDKDGTLKHLMPINTRRLGDPVLDNNNDMSYEGVIIDGQGVIKTSIIYGVYDANQISPHTEYFGYSTVESVLGVAQSLSTLLEEDVPEIAKSAWLATILLTINTMGLSEADAQSKIDAVIDAIKAGKVIGVNESAMDTKILDLKPNFDGVVNLINKAEAIIFKAYQVPQFLVQNEGVANRATAVQSGQNFLDGVISKDQNMLQQIFTEQYYDPLLRKELGLKEEDELPFHLKRVYNKAKVADFVDLADALVALKNAGIWDVQKANETLGSEEVTARVKSQQEKADVRSALDQEKLKLIKKMNGEQPEAVENDKPGDNPSDPKRSV